VTDRRSIGLIWALAGVALALAGIAVAAHVGQLGPLSSPHLPWWALALGFAAAERAVVHLHFRRSAQSVTLSDLPWVLGLIFASAPQLLIGALLGSAAVWILDRRLAPLKLVLNVAQLAVAVCISETIVHAYTSHAATIGPGLWLATLAAIEAGALVSLAMIAAAIALSEGPLTLPALRQMFGVDLVTTIANTTLALTAAVVLREDSEALALMLVPAAIVYVAYRGYFTERQRHDKLEFLYEAARTLAQAPDVIGALEGLLERAREAFRVEFGELLLFSSHGQTPLRIASPSSGDAAPQVPLDAGAADELRALVEVQSPVRLGAPSPQAGALEAYLHSRGARQAIAAQLPGDGRIVGIVLLANRIGVVRGFDAEDVKLLRALARDTSVAFQFDRLEQAIWQLRELQDRLDRQASTDALTGLPNRDAFAAELAKALDADAGSLSVLFLDVDDFKRVNESIGPARADELLIAIAQRVAACVLPTDTVARLGGDEFAVLLRDVDDPMQAGLAAAERIRRALSTPLAAAGKRALAQASIGIAAGRSGYDDADELMRNADVAMYQAKRSGKGRAALFEPRLRSAAIDRHGMRADVEMALERGQLRVDYQPIVSLADRRVAGVEALLRWQREYGKLLTANEFVPLAQETGSIVAFGEFVLADACRHARDWVARGALGPAASVHINLSATELDDPLLAARMTDAIERSRLEPATLVIEVSEATVLRDVRQANLRLTQLREIGVRLAIDQFGTGHAALSYLRELPVSFVKVAQTFVQSLTRGPQEIAFLRTITELCQTLGLRLVATGVETHEQLELLTSLGCDLGQGFLIGRPASGESILATAFPPAADPGGWLRAGDDVEQLFD
jgi:diguanylate cyclase (GGDEF)-like protein